MSINFSRFGQRFTSQTGILELMQDLGEALNRPAGEKVAMLGGGNPAAIPAVQAIWRKRMEELMADPSGFDRLVGNYDPPNGNPAFIQAMADMLNRMYGWNLTSRNIAVTNGGQTAFFFLMNLLGQRGECSETRREILLPLVPEYIGYADLGVDGPAFRACRPIIEKEGEREFKYRIDFDALEVRPETAAMCVSRPTNPSGNVLTDEEIARLVELAQANSIPLIIDNAYGAPFPNIIFREINPVWNENIILTMSLSKIGLPGTRTGIVVAREEIIEAMTSLNAIVGLSNSSLGQAIVTPLVESGEIIEMSNQLVKPYYEAKSKFALGLLNELMPAETPWRVHTSDGAMFLWIWLPGLPGGSKELYRRLKEKNVIVVPGDYFFFGMDEGGDWPHARECVRMSFSMEPEALRMGIGEIGRQVAEMYAGK